MKKTISPAVIGLLLAWPLATGLTLPSHGPLPQPRPDRAIPAPETDTAADGAKPRDEATMPTPQGRPTPPSGEDSPGKDGPETPSSETKSTDAETGKDTQQRPDGPQPKDAAKDDAAGKDEPTEGETVQEAAPVDPPPAPEDPKALAACLADLRRIGARFETHPAAIDDEGGCGMAAPVTVKMLLPDVALEPEATIRCETALQLARMTRDMLKPAAEAAFPDKPKLTGIRQASGYVCRNRNSADDGKVSEHAYGNAIDIAGLRFGEEEQPVMIARQDDGTAEAAFQRAFNALACLYFTTVLSPGSDPTHQDHMHLDVIERKSGFRYCR